MNGGPRDWADPARLGYRRRSVALLLLLGLLTGVAEFNGLALALPVLMLAESNAAPATLAGQSPLFEFVFRAFTFAGLPVSLLSLILVVCAITLVLQGLQYAQAVYRAQVLYTAVQRLRSRTFRTLVDAELGFTERLRSGTLVNILFTESKRAAALVLLFVNLAVGAVKIALYVGLTLMISWKSTVVAAALAAFVTYVSARSPYRHSTVAGLTLTEVNDRLSRHAAERAGLLRLIKLSGTEGLETGTFSDLNAHYARLQTKLAAYGARLEAVLLTVSVFLALGGLYVTVAVLETRLAELGVLVLILFRLVPVAQQMATSLQQVASNVAAAKYIHRISAEGEAERQADRGTRAFPDLETGICFEKVSFGYRDESGAAVDALKDIDLLIPARKTTAFVGASGAGKSTLLDLIPRLREPSAGTVRFDATPASEIGLSELRRHIAVVSQETLMVDGSVADNLRYGVPGASEEAIREAARMASADAFIAELPAGYDTVLGERGVRLSGGQRQRIALARALLRRVPVLLLDEPTSALDAQSEQAIHEALDRLRRERRMTIVIIAHRLSTIRGADLTVVLEGGRVLGTGTHAQLMDSAPWYRRIVELQTANSPVEAAQRPMIAREMT